MKALLQEQKEKLEDLAEKLAEKEMLAYLKHMHVFQSLNILYIVTVIITLYYYSYYY